MDDADMVVLYLALYVIVPEVGILSPFGAEWLTDHGARVLVVRKQVACTVRGHARFQHESFEEERVLNGTG